MRSRPVNNETFSFTLANGEQEVVTANFTVASDANVGDVSPIVVTATSQLDNTQNSALAQLVVVSDVRSYRKYDNIMIF